jgi:hypothetical protein
MRYRLLRAAVLAVVPYWYLKMYLEGIEVCPSDYFLRLLSERKGRYAQAMLFVTVLSIAARSFDATMALSAVSRLKSPLPLWATSHKDIKLLLEASLWLGSTREFNTIREEMLGQSGSSSRVRSILSFYDSFMRNETEATDAKRGQFVLPALFWGKVAAKTFSEGRARESADALHEALRFIPEGDPKRAEFVAWFNQADTILHKTAG